jgi:hypothetical protein
MCKMFHDEEIEGEMSFSKLFCTQLYTPGVGQLQSPQLKTVKCHSNLVGWNGLTNQNLPLAISVPSPPPSHMLLTWHSGTEVVTSGLGNI